MRVRQEALSALRPTLTLLTMLAALAGCATAPAPRALAIPTAHDAQLAAVLSRWDADAHSDLRGVVVLRDGALVAERYFNGETAGDLHDVRSAGKSITALLMTIAVDTGHIRSLDQRVQDHWPQAGGSAIGDVTLRDVLSMRSGLAAFDEDPDSPGHEDKLDEAPDPVQFTLAVPRAEPPGQTYRYNSLTAYVAGLVVEKATRQPMADFARSRLFTPLGITDWRWDADAAGHTKGQGNLWLTARGMATLGEMVRCGGRYRGTRVISEAGVADALRPQVAIAAVDPYADAYGHFWYAKTLQVNGRQVPISFASGNGGNKIYVVPRLHLVIAITSSAYGKGYGQRRSQDILMAVLGALPPADQADGAGPPLSCR